MPYWIHRNGENVGPYDLPQLQDMLAAGQATAGDLAIEEGSSEWSTVGDLTSAAPPPTAEPVMAELVSAAPTNEPDDIPEAVPAGKGSTSILKLGLGVVVVLLVIGGGVYAFSEIFTKYLKGDKGEQAQAVVKAGDDKSKPPPGKNTPKPNDSKPGELLEPPGKSKANPDTNLFTNSPPNNLPSPPINTGKELPTTRPLPPIDPPIIPSPNDNKLIPQPATEAIKHIPANAIGVASINLGQLLKKAGGYQALLNKVMQAAGPEANDPMIKNMAGLFAPDKLAANFGIGINEPLLAFTTGDMKVGVLLPVSDATKLELAIPNIAVMLKAEFPELQPADGYKYVSFPQKAAGVALGPKAVLVLIDTKAVEQGQPKDLTQELAQLMKLPAAGGGQLAQARPNFAKHAQMPYDGALWINSKEVIKIALRDMPMPNTDDEIKLVKNILGGLGDELAAGLSFQQGRIVIEALMAYEDKFYGSWGNEADLDAGILDAIPGNSIAVLTQSMNMDVIRTFIDKRMEAVTAIGQQGGDEFFGEMNAMLANFGLTSESLIKLPGGDLAISLVGLDAGKPEILFSMNVSDPARAAEVLDKIKATPTYEGLQQFGFDAIIKGNVLHIAPLSLKNSIEKGQNGNPLSLEARKLLGENDSALYFSVASLTGALPPMDPAAMAMVQQFKGINVIGNADPAGQRFTATVAMADPNANVLQTLVDQAFKQVMQLQNGGGLPFPQPPGPSPFPPPQGFGEVQREDEGNKTNTLPTPSPLPSPQPPLRESNSTTVPSLPKAILPVPPPTKNSPPAPAPPVPEPNPFNPK
ncbi:MAG: DUF4836 family protein [Verrucomicrobiota bacterium]|nr:DUF4836 family protein [Verrucomicrobiota bacterium]